MELDKLTSFLVIDDFELMRKSLQTNLRSLGYERVYAAENGKAALPILRSNTIDCIISDWKMPQMNGLQLLQMIRGDVRYQNIHFIMVTAEGERNMVTRAIEAGVDQFLIKPFTQASLREKITNMSKHNTRVMRKPPVLPQDSDTSQDDNEDNESNIKPLVLAVDDVATNITIIADTLRGDYIVKAANNGASALKICHSERKPDLILLDIMMPNMDGYQVCQTLKNDPETEHIPIIFLTAKAEQLEMKKGFEYGAVDYITKPCNPAILRARVATHMNLKLAKDSLEERVDALVDNARLREDVERITRHDLKNPLSAIITTCEHLIGEEDSPNYKKSVTDIRESALSILGMINRSLDIYKIETGVYRAKLKPMNLQELMQRLINKCQIQTSNRGIAINYHYQPTNTYRVVAEEMLCIPMFNNLLTNAIEASPDNGSIDITITEMANQCQVAIHNAGMVPEAIQASLFEKYVTAGKKEGTGLGTYSAKLMAETQMGTIDYTTSEQEGTTFTVTLPKQT